MSSSNESIQKTVTVALLLCLVCSVVVSASAVMLRPAQAVNEQANMQMNILQAAGLYDPQQTVQEQFELSRRVLWISKQVSLLKGWMLMITTSVKQQRIHQ